MTIIGGSLALSGSNIYTGATTITAGTLQIGAGGTTGNLGLAAVTNNATLLLNRSDNALNVANAVSGTGAVIQAGSGLATLSGSNTYSGGTFVNAGMLAFASTGAVPAGTANVTVNPGGVLLATGAYSTLSGWINSGNIASRSSGVLAMVGGTDNGSLSLANYPTLWLSASGSATYSGTLTQSSTNNNYFGGASGTLTMATPIGGNNVFVSGPGATIFTAGNTYAGNTTVNSGTLQVGNGGNAQGVLPSQTIANAGTLVYNHADATTFSGSLSGTGALVQSGNGMLTLAGGGIAYTGPTTITAGTLQIAGAGGMNGGNYANTIADSGAFVVNTSSNQTFGGVISGNGALYQLGSNLTTLTAANNYTGNTIVSNGTLQVGNGAASGSLGSGTLANNATVVFNRNEGTTNDNYAFANIVSGSGAMVYVGPDFYWPSSGSNTNTGITVLTNGAGLYNITPSGGTDATALGPAPATFVPNDLTISSGVIITANSTWGGGVATVIAANRGIYLSGGTATFRNGWARRSPSTA